MRLAHIKSEKELLGSQIEVLVVVLVVVVGGGCFGSLHLLTGTPKTARPLGSIALHCSTLPDEGPDPNTGRLRYNVCV